MVENHNESPTTDDKSTMQVDGRHRGAGCRSALSVMFVIFFGLASLVARVESDEELFVVIILDLLIGAAIIQIGVQNTPRGVKRTRRWKRILPVVVLASIVSGFLISWQSSAYFARKNAYRQFLEQQPKLPEGREHSSPPND